MSLFARLRRRTAVVVARGSVPHGDFALFERWFTVDGPMLELARAACHRDGHTREAAVMVLAEMDGPVVAPLLALRAAEWVPQVRERARAACARRLDEWTPAFAPMAFTLRGRASGDWLADHVDRVLRDGPIETLMAVLDSDDRDTRRTAYRVGAGRLPRRHLLTAVLSERDVVVRRLCADAVLRDADNTAVEAVGRVLGGDDPGRRDLPARALGWCRPGPCGATGSQWGGSGIRNGGPAPRGLRPGRRLPGVGECGVARAGGVDRRRRGRLAGPLVEPPVAACPGPVASGAAGPATGRP